MAGGASGGERTLQETPTWAVASVCAVFVVLSVLIEHGIHLLEKVHFYFTFFNLLLLGNWI